MDREGKLVGVVTDQALLRALGGQIKGSLAFGMGRRARLAARPISGIMERGLKTATERMTVYEALGLMTQYGLKRIPVVDEKGVFRGMIRRDSIMLAFARLWDASTEDQVKRQLTNGIPRTYPETTGDGVRLTYPAPRAGRRFNRPRADDSYESGPMAEVAYPAAG